MLTLTKNLSCGVVILLLVALFTSGCGDSFKSRVMEVNDSNIRILYNFYQLYIHRHQMQGPESEEEFKAFLKSKAVEVNLGFLDLDASDVDELFVSDRDGEPFKIKYGVNGSGAAIIFESTGVNGTRMVAFNPPKEVSDAAEYGPSSKRRSRYR